MYKPYSQRTSLAIVAVVGCVALWAVVIAFTNMNDEINQLERDVATLKMQTTTKPHIPPVQPAQPMKPTTTSPTNLPSLPGTPPAPATAPDLYR